MIFQGGRSVVRLPQLRLQCGTHGPSLYHLQRVTALHNNSQLHNLLNIALRNPALKLTSCRAYATRPASRPKAHTGRTTTAPRKAPTTSKTKAAKKPAPKKTSAKPKPSAKSTAKPRSKAKRKPAKAKAKPKPRKKTKRTVLTEAQKNARTIKNLKEAALQPPKGVPATAWLVFSQEDIRGQRLGDRSLASRMKEHSAEFKNLTPERLEHYNQIANQNKAKNDLAYRQWIESHTPTVIFAANLARKSLKNRKVSGYTTPLQDHRQVKNFRTAYNFFYTERYASGDFRGLKVTESTKLAGREWKALSGAEKKPYEDSAKEDMARYTLERKTVLNKDVKHTARAAAAA